MLEVLPDLQVLLLVEVDDHKQEVNVRVWLVNGQHCFCFLCY